MSKGTALVLPHATTAATTLHLAEISRSVVPSARAVVLLDQAGWHSSTKLAVLDNVTLLPLPPQSPGMNPVGNIGRFRRDIWLSNRIFAFYQDNLDHGRFAWSPLINVLEEFRRLTAASDHTRKRTNKFL